MTAATSDIQALRQRVDELEERILLTADSLQSAEVENAALHERANSLEKEIAALNIRLDQLPIHV